MGACLSVAVLVFVVISSFEGAGLGLVPAGTATAAPGVPAPPVSHGPKTSGVAPVLGHLVNGRVIANTSKSFWSIDLQTAAPKGIETSSLVQSYLANTPFRWVRYGGNTEQCNITRNVQYGDNGQPAGGCAFNVTSLKQWCATQTPTCHAILDLPAENNNSAELANIANYVVNTVGFQPTYWSIGNEPSGWTHYGIPWTQWRVGDHSTPTPMEYAYDVRAAITAVRAVDPAAQFIGIESACPCNTVWFQDVVRVDGPNIAALAVHNYPSDLTHGATRETLAQFYAPLADPQNITGAIHDVRTAIHGLCGRCGTIPIFVNEYNAGPGWAPSNHAGTYANAVFLAASVAQALDANVQQMTFFDLQTGAHGFGYSLLNGAGTVAPTGSLFSRLLSHLAIGHVYRDPVRTSIGGVWSVVTRGGGVTSLLVVNTNLSHGLKLGLAAAFPTGVLSTIYTWAPGAPLPTATSRLVPLDVTIPSQGILLVDTSAPPLGAPVPPTGGHARIATHPVATPVAPARNVHAPAWVPTDSLAVEPLLVADARRAL
jgi:hypothetical protein